MMDKHLKWFRNWCPMHTLPKENRFVALAYTRLTFRVTYQPLLLLAALLGLQLILFGTVGSVGIFRTQLDEWYTTYVWSNFFWSCAAVFAAIMLYAMLRSSRHLAFLSASAALVFVAFQHISEGFSQVILSIVNERNSDLVRLVLRVNGVSSIFAAIPLLLVSFFLARNRVFSKKQYYLIILYGLIQMPSNAAIFLYMFSPNLLSEMLEALQYLFQVSTCFFMVLAAKQALKLQSSTELGKEVLRPLGATFLSYGGAQLAAFAYVLALFPFYGSQPNYLLNASYRALLAALSLLYLGVAAHLIRIKTLRLS